MAVVVVVAEAAEALRAAAGVAALDEEEEEEEEEEAANTVVRAKSANKGQHSLKSSSCTAKVADAEGGSRLIPRAQLKDRARHMPLHPL